MDLPTGAFRTIYNGVPDLGAAAPRARRPGDPLVIGSLGRLHRQKGYDVLLRALAEIAEAELVLVGDGEERVSLEALAHELGVAGRVRFAGWDADARARLAGFDIFVLPSRFEAFPLSIVEAMLAGRPVVATDVGSVREAVRHGETGLLVLPDDPAALAAALVRLLGDGVDRARLAAAGRQLAARRFTPAVMAAAFERLYQELLE
jgi:glycosyltransferase involved in cell wall biosynthesis